ncbi:MAG: hypothetical protein H7Y17_07475 [Chlorobia bacterium]|nr:hypothetical protein [Fimbriimonadaceae bacterium]
MRTIGFTGGSSIQTLGSIAEVQLFFDLASEIAKSDASQLELVVDRLYKRYIRLADIPAARDQMAIVRARFEGKQIDVSTLKVDPANSALNQNGTNAAQVFSKYFEAFEHVAETALLSFEAFKDFPDYQPQPLKTVITDLDEFMVETERPLFEYDNLVGAPFWKR